MKIIETVSHPQLKISIFGMNDKYQIKFEAGPYEQTYKIAQDEVSLDGLRKMIDESFCDEVIQIFRQMNRNWQSAREI